jgi:hypothetical protein
MLLLYRVSKMPKNKNKRKSFFSFYFFPVKWRSGFIQPCPCRPSKVNSWIGL